MVLSFRKIHEWRSEIGLGSDFLYYAVTTLVGKKTLGEEYCNISQRDSTGMFPGILRRSLQVLISVLGPYLVNRKVHSYEQKLSTFVFEQNAKFEAL